MTNIEKINPFEYGYGGKEVNFDGDVIMLISRFLGEVIEKETDFFAGLSYPSKIKEVKDDSNKIVQVIFEDVKEYESPESFLMSSIQDNGAVLGLTSTGVKASQILSALLNWHEKNIINGVAKKQENIDEERVFES